VSSVGSRRGFDRRRGRSGKTGGAGDASRPATGSPIVVSVLVIWGGVLTFSMRSSDSIVFSRNILVLSLMTWTFWSSSHTLRAASLILSGSSSASAAKATDLSTASFVRSDFFSRSRWVAASELTVRPTSRSFEPPSPVGLTGGPSMARVASLGPFRVARRRPGCGSPAVIESALKLYRVIHQGEERTNQMRSRRAMTENRLESCRVYV
jgi:hypothetical protein